MTTQQLVDEITTFATQSAEPGTVKEKSQKLIESTIAAVKLKDGSQVILNKLELVKTNIDAT